MAQLALLQVATLFLFGQTGSGKSHTMTGLMRRAVQDLFAESETDSVTCILATASVACVLIISRHVIQS